MRVLLISFWSRWTHHLATELEIIQRHLDSGDDVVVLACHGDVPACDGNIQQNPALCRECITHRFLGMKMLTSLPTVYSLGNFYRDADKRKESELKTTFDTIGEIRDYHVDGVDIGYAALSSTVGKFRDPAVEKSEHKEVLGRMVRSCYRSFCATREFLKVNDRFDRAYIFNGRHAVCRGAFRACQVASLDVYLHERGSDNSRFMLFDNVLPHDRNAALERIDQTWAKADEEGRQNARLFYERRRERVESEWYSFTKEQVKNKLPDGWDDSCRNVVVFTSSEDEFVAIGKEWENPHFKSQTSAIVDLGRVLAERKSHNVRLYVRVHPNLRDVDNQDTRELRRLDLPNVEIIPPESDVCSYTMLDHAASVITFGSTMGIEAVYWGKPSILAGICFYRGLGGTYNPTTLDELVELTFSALEPKPQEAALKYGLYAVRFGEPFKHYTAHDFFNGTFNGKELQLPIPYAPYRALIPVILRRMGNSWLARRILEPVAYAVAYLPFLWAFRGMRSLRNRCRAGIQCLRFGWKGQNAVK